MRKRPSSTAISSPPAVKVPAKTSLRAFWLMLMKPPAPASLRPKRLTLTLPCRVRLRQPEAGEVEPAAVVEVELLVLVDDGAGVERRAEVEPALRQAADDARLRRQGHEILSTFSSAATAATPSGMPMPRLTTPPRRQLERAAARDDLALVERQRRDPGRAAPACRPEKAWL